MEQVGLSFRELILGAAGLLREEWTPGAVSLGLVALAVLAALALVFRDIQRRRALRWARRTVCRAKGRRDFVDKVVDVHRAMTEARDAPRGRPAFVRAAEYRRPLGVAWGEYHETMVHPEPESEDVVRNSLRPNAFFDAEDLGFDGGWWRILPGLFVSVGLLLTFLGLIAALTAIGGAEITDDSLRELLNAASAKFIMSLTGLACSIGLTVVLRISGESVQHEVRRLCHAIEKRLRFQSLEEIAADQLRVARDQGDAMRQVATEMVAELSRPLREDLPNAIGQSIRSEVAPLFEQLGQSSEEGLGQMVGTLSDQISRDVGAALAEASGRLGDAADRLAVLAEQMENGTGRMGAEYEAIAARMGEQMAEMQTAMQSDLAQGREAMNEGVEALLKVVVECLTAIRENTSSGSQAIASAAADMRAAAEGFRQEIESAAGAGAITVGAEMQRAAEAAGGAIANATSELTAPLSDLAMRLEAAADATQGGAESLAQLATAAQSGGEAIARGADRLERASTVMSSAADPIKDGISGLQASTREMTEGVSTALATARQHSDETSRRTRDALEAASQILGDQQTGISAAMEGLAAALREMRGQGDRLDTMDQKLGAAFEQYRTQVEATMNGTAEQVRGIVEILNPALDTMKSVVEQAEHFAPQSSAGNNGVAWAARS